MFGQKDGGMQAREYVRSIGFESGASCCYDPGQGAVPPNAIDAVNFNGRMLCGRPGFEANRVRTPVLILSEDEWISDIHTASWAFLNYVRLETNKKRPIEASGTGNVAEKQKFFAVPHVLQTRYSNVRVLQIGVWGGWVVGGLDIEFVENYKPSTVVKTNVTAILDSAAPGSTYETYKESNLNTLSSIEKTSESIRGMELNASVAADYYVKVAASTKLETKDSSKEVVQQKSEAALKAGDKATSAPIPPGSVAFQLATCDLMKSSDGKHFLRFQKQSGTGWAVNEKSSFPNLVGCFDISSTAAFQAGLVTNDKDYGIRMVTGVKS